MLTQKDITNAITTLRAQSCCTVMMMGDSIAYWDDADKDYAEECARQFGVPCLRRPFAVDVDTVQYAQG